MRQSFLAGKEPKRAGEIVARVLHEHFTWSIEALRFPFWKKVKLSDQATPEDTYLPNYLQFERGGTLAG